MPQPTARILELSKSIRRIPIAEATPDLVAACVKVATQGTRDGVAEVLLPLMLKRIGGNDPLDIIIDAEGAAGWAGLVPYGDPSERTRQSSTFFAPRLRGTGMLTVARCWQAHHAQAVTSEHGDSIRVVTSIGEWNERSYAATSRYARIHGWPDTWRDVLDKTKGQVDRVIDWPIPVPHTCLHAALDSNE